jgi:hypothetical protein
VEGPDRLVAVGTWEQIQEDVRKLEAAGVDETFFDVAFQPDGQTQRSLLDYMEKFRGILEAPVHA